MAITIFQNALFQEIILPFLLIFAVTFAVLQKSKVLGDGKAQSDAIVAFVIGLIFIGFYQAVDVVRNLIPVLGVSLVVILIFMLLVGFLYGGNFDLHANVKYGITAIIFIVVIIAVLVATDSWDNIVAMFSGESSSSLVSNIVFIVLMIVVIAVVVISGKSGGSSDKDK